jgi:hypothetical protein
MGRLAGAFWHLIKLALRLGALGFVALLLWVWFANPYEDVAQRTCGTRPEIGIERLEALAPGYRRAESSTYLSYPEWYIVYNSEEYARTIASARPSRFPYFRSIGQYWRGYYRVFKITQAKYGFSARDHLLLMVIGAGFTLENGLKGIYENTVGLLSERLSKGVQTEEDRYAAQVADEYGKLAHSIPFYQFPYGRALSGLWRDTPFRGASQGRKWERKAVLTVEYALKGMYGLIIRAARKALHGDMPLQVYAFTSPYGRATGGNGPARELERPMARSSLLSIPRYEKFSEIVPALLKRGVTIYEIAGNDEIFLTALAPVPWKGVRDWHVVMREPILTDAGRVRVGLTVPVSCLARVLADLEASGARLEHLYDY